MQVATVSVIMPAYNMAEYILSSIGSVQHQTYPFWELIVVDDGSNDRTAEIVRTVSTIDSRVRLIIQKNQGVASARNNGIFSAQGRYIAFLDADDYWDESFLAKLLARQEQSDSKLVFCGYKEIYLDGREKENQTLYSEGNILLNYIDFKTRIPMGSFIVDRDILDENGIIFSVGCKMGEDQEFMLKLLAIVDVTCVKEKLLIYRRRPNSATMGKWDHKYCLDALQGYQRALIFIQERTKHRFDGEIILTRLKQKIARELCDMLCNLLVLGRHSELFDIYNNASLTRWLSYLRFNRLNLGMIIKYSVVCLNNKKIWRMFEYLVRHRYNTLT